MTSERHIQLLGERLERSRLMQNISQIDLAKQAGISPRTLRRLEAGQGGSMDSFIRLLIALNLDDNLEVLIPDHTVRPMERARQANTERQRASRSSKQTSNTGKSTNQKDKDNKDQSSKSGTHWTWGDEQS